MKSLVKTVLLWACFALLASAQSVVPRIISFTGAVNGANGKPLTGAVSITFSLYAEQQSGTPLWSELQTVQADSQGHYTVFLGSTTNGMPLELFTAGTARWLAIRPDVPGLEDPARILLVGRYVGR